MVKGKKRPGARHARKVGFGNASSRSATQKIKAASHAAALLNTFPRNALVAFTDGACLGNPGPCGAGATLTVREDGKVRVAEASVSLGSRGTNNIGELAAIGLALTLLERAEKLQPELRARPVNILTDSRYTQGSLQENWKSKKNVALIQRLRHRLAARPNVVIHWVAGHAGIAGNERADALASEAAEKSKGKECFEWDKFSQKKFSETSLARRAYRWVRGA